ncbi:MAG: hypothetical protein CVU90_14735 [Firmicutes bacterium HGW-Firmicutes-15]|nr:MAG: hypothetical protein CVU90_14735 [Firmicutes bacterium HGW-Firmicutes-15]
MEKILSIIVPAMLLAYYLKTSWLDIKDKKILLVLMIGGTVLFYVGLLFRPINQLLGSTLQLVATCLFFTAVAINISNRPKEKAPDPGFQQDEDSE